MEDKWKKKLKNQNDLLECSVDNILYSYTVFNAFSYKIQRTLFHFIIHSFIIELIFVYIPVRHLFFSILFLSFYFLFIAWFHISFIFSFSYFFIWALLLIVHILNSSPLQSNLLQLQCTCTIPTTSGRPHGSPLVWPSQPLSSPQLSYNDSFWA